MKTNIHLLYQIQFFLKWGMFLRKDQNKRFIHNILFQKLCLLWNNVDKYFRVGQATDDN